MIHSPLETFSDMHNLRPDPYEDSNALSRVRRFRKRLFFGRHFKSTANEDDVIVSHPEKGKVEGGLVPVEIDQVVREVRESTLTTFDREKIRIVSSPLLRAVQTSQLYSEVLELKEDPFLHEDARERWFGDFDGMNNAVHLYNTVWGLDLMDPTHKQYGVESVIEVRSRMTRLAKSLDEDDDPREVVVLVGHGDGATILYSGISKFNPAFHHKYIRYLRNGQAKPLIIGDESWLG